MGVRTLLPAPHDFVDPRTGAPAFGSYAGPLPAVRLGLDRVARLLRRKKWLYVALSSDELWVALAVVRTGYASTAFAFVLDHATKELVADVRAMGPSKAAEVADDPRLVGVVTRFGGGRSRVVVRREGEAWEVRARLGDLAIEATLDAARAPPAISAIASLDGGLRSATEKRALMAATGTVDVGRDRRRLEGLGGYDYTQGEMPRRTRWRWAFALGRTPGGEPVGFNVVSGFVGEPECAAFVGDRVLPLGEPRITFEPGHPDRPWRVEGEGIEATFVPSAVHRQSTNLVLVRSRFLQPVGRFDGVLRAGGREIRLDQVPGVVEDQDVVW